MKKKCINIDWLEVYCKESLDNTPCDAGFFRAHGFFVREREYGTRQYRQMFTLEGEDNEPMYEIRREPVAQDSRVKGMFDPTSCHIRLHNRQCYHPEAVNRLHDFLQRFKYTVVRIYRLDICHDFERFDEGDDPQKFIERYMNGKYSKVNQGNISAHGADRWEARLWNSISWGAPSSMVSTKMYDKTAEIASNDKPYIRYAWFCAGLVDDWEQLVKKSEDGTQYKPRIWRVEFSIRSSARGYYIIEDHGGKKTQTIQAEHTLSSYNTPEKLLHAFNCLQQYYFHFKHYVPGVRKDRCEDKKLFNFTEDTQAVARIDRLLTTKRNTKNLDTLISRLEAWREYHADQKLRQACSVVINAIRDERMIVTVPTNEPAETITALRLLLSRRIKGTGQDVAHDVQDVQMLMQSLDDLFGELNEK